MSGVYALEDQRLVRVDHLPASTGVCKDLPCPLAEPAPFFRSLAFLSKTGYPLGGAFRLLGSGMERACDAEVCIRLESCLSTGMSLSEAFRVNRFPRELVSALEAGEVAGRMEEAMEWYAGFEEANVQIRREIKQALLNPMITLSFSLLFAVLLPPFVLREQLEMLAQSGVQLPLISKLLLAFSQFVTSPFALLILPLGYLGLVALRSYISTVHGRRKFERALHKVPVLGEALRRAAGARCLALMAMIMRSGGSPTAAMLIGGKGCGSRLLKDRLQISVHSLIGGIPFAESLLKTRWFLSSSIYLLQAGEAVGDTSEMMVLASRIEEEKLRDALSNVAAVVQPMALLLIGVLVCTMVIAVLGPSLSIVSGF
jgi:type II secretory pathway component PulF